MVGGGGHEDADVDAAPGRGQQRAPHRPVGDEVRLGDRDVLGRAVDRLEVHATDRVDQLRGHVAVHAQARLPQRRAVLGKARLRRCAVLVPEVDERVLELPRRGSADTQMGVAPLRGVRAADVVSADEADLAVDDQQLAVVATGLAHVQEQHPGLEGRVAHDVHRRGEVEEGALHDEVREHVVDHEDLDSTLGGGDQRRLEALPDLVVLDDERLEQHALARAVDGREHVLVEGRAVRVDGDDRLAEREIGSLGPRECRLARAHALAPRVDGDQRAGRRGLRGDDRERDAAQETPQWADDVVHGRPQCRPVSRRFGAVRSDRRWHVRPEPGCLHR